MPPTFLQPPAHTGRVSTGLLILRVVLGLAFIQYGPTKVGHPTSWANPLALGIPLALLFCGPGAYSIDALLARNARDAALLPSHR
jgi:uncharacterized membrane protein YphA (DoxX/SURF4 family)